MELEKFAETYSKLEEKSLEIMKIYGICEYTLDNISIDRHACKLLFYINTSIYYRGCSESESLVFDLEEMNNDIEYFKTKHKEMVDKTKHDRELAKEKEIETKRISKQLRDEAEYKNKTVY